MAKDGYITTRFGDEISLSFLQSLKLKLYYAPKQRKMELLVFSLRKRFNGKAILFRRTTFGADKALKTLTKNGFKAVCVHSEKTAEEKADALKQFESDDVKILVITDTALRDVQLKKVEFLINFDLPAGPETFFDRQLLTYGKGVSITFCSIEEKSTVRAIEEQIEKKFIVEKNHPYNDDPDEFIAGVRRPKGTAKKSRKSDSSKKKKKRWY